MLNLQTQGQEIPVLVLIQNGEVHPVNLSPSWPPEGKIIDKSSHYMSCQT